MKIPLIKHLKKLKTHELRMLQARVDSVLNSRDYYAQYDLESYSNRSEEQDSEKWHAHG